MATRTPTGQPVEAAPPQGHRVATEAGTSAATTPHLVHLAELGRLVAGPKDLTRQSLIRRGRSFAHENGLRVFTQGRDEFVSSAAIAHLLTAEAVTA